MSFLDINKNGTAYSPTIIGERIPLQELNTARGNEGDLRQCTYSTRPLDGKVEKAWMDREAKMDYDHIAARKDKVIAGFLGIGKKDGWDQEEGGGYETGYRFTRYMLRKFWQEKSTPLAEQGDLVRRVIQSFSPESRKNNEEAPRAYFDPTISGWYKHAVSRFLGNVCKDFRSNGPFFEVLVNSAKTSKTDSRSFPFSVSVLPDHPSGELRANQLKIMAQQTERAAYPSFYSSGLDTPSAFIQRYQEQHGKKPGPNALRILDGLQYLSNQKLKAQTIGNCWVKPRPLGRGEQISGRGLNPSHPKFGKTSPLRGRSPRRG